MKPHIYLALLVVAGGCGVYWMTAAQSPLPDAAIPSNFIAKPPQPPSHSPANTSMSAARQAQDIATLKRELTDLKAEIAALNQFVRSQAASQPLAGRDEKTPQLRDPLAQADAEQQRQQQIALIEAGFRSETTDADWSAASLAKLQAALAKPALQSALRSMECRSRTCRVEIAHASTDVQKILPLFANQLADSLPNLTAGEVDGSTGDGNMVLYLSRDGG